jgi:hypothetical protein
MQWPINQTNANRFLWACNKISFAITFVVTVKSIQEPVKKRKS